MPGRLRVDLSRPQDIVHCLLFIIEYSNSADRKWQAHKRHLSLFLSRAGGLHLLLMLLNAFYNKPVAGRRPGWTFTSMRDRIQISERGLRMLINDAVAEGLIEQLPVAGSLDRRCRSYRLTPQVVEAWGALMAALHKSMSDVLGEFDAGALANTDYRRWNPDVPALDQVEPLPPSHRLRRRV
jgi:DNA-binding MarR family transcriptional regulator